MRSETRIISLKEKKSFVLFFFFFFFSSRFKSFIYCTLIDSLISGPLFFFFSFLFGAAGPPTQIVSSSSHVGRSSRRRRSQIFERHKKGPRKINIYLFSFLSFQSNDTLFSLYKEFLFGFYPLFFWSDWLPLIVTYIFPPFF